jgi:hypothetical protein
VVAALGSHGRGHRFDTCRAHHLFPQVGRGPRTQPPAFIAWRQVVGQHEPPLGAPGGPKRRAAVLIILAVELTARLWLLVGADQVAAGKDRAAKMISGVPG